MNYFKETLHAGFEAGYEVSAVHFESDTLHQHLIIFENPLFGKVMALDGIIQTTQRDEFIYHEMFAHMPLLIHPNPRHVLIVGGGDGGLLREVVRYESLESITMVEIDQAVIDLAKKYLPEHSNGSFADPRLNLVIGDGLDFICNCQQRFDVILSDSTDPIGPGEALFAERFYQECSRCLKEDGLLVTQNGVSFLQPQELQTTYKRMSGYFPLVKFFQADVPTYVGGNMNYAWAQKNAKLDISLVDIKTKFKELGLDKIARYFTPAFCETAFVLPKYLEEAVYSTTEEEVLV